MSTVLVEYDYDRERIYAVAQIEGETRLFFIDVALTKGGIESFNAWESSMHFMALEKKKAREK